uniref:Transmembrane protein n=1 Tax=Panagrolaimus davidi TaxID=227884 RepID=A0A914PYH9_9BILA
MQGFVAVLLLVIVTCNVFGENIAKKEFDKELVMSNAVKHLTSSNGDATCPAGLIDDMHAKCGYPSTSCSSDQKLLDCGIGVVRKECNNVGSGDIQGFCDGFDRGLRQQGISCDLKCNSASSFFVTGSVIAIVLFKMFFEKLISSF